MNIHPIFKTISETGIRHLAESNAKAAAEFQHDQKNQYWCGQMDVFELVWNSLPLSDKERMRHYFLKTYLAELARLSADKQKAAS